ncbi:MAG: hypothetical protein AAB588_00130 [Patescibacteria group bacterium]
MRKLIEISTTAQKLVTEQREHPTTLTAYQKTILEINNLIADYSLEMSMLVGHYAVGEILNLQMEEIRTVEWDKIGEKVISTKDISTIGTVLKLISEQQVSNLTVHAPQDFVDLAVHRQKLRPLSTDMDMKPYTPEKDFAERLTQAFVDLLKQIENNLHSRRPAIGIIETRYKFKMDDDERRRVAERILQKVGSNTEEFPRIGDLLDLRDSLTYQESFLEQGMEPPAEPTYETADIASMTEGVGESALAVVDKSSALVNHGRRQVLEVLAAVSPPYQRFMLARAQSIRTEITFDYYRGVAREWHATATEEHVGLHRTFLVDQFHAATHAYSACALLHMIMESFDEGTDFLHMLKTFFVWCEDLETCEAVWDELQNYEPVLTNELLAEIALYTTSDRVAQAAIAECRTRGLDAESILEKRAGSLVAHREVKSQEARDRNYKKIRDLTAELRDKEPDGKFIDNTVARIRACTTSEEEARKILVNVLLHTNLYTAWYLWSKHIIESHMSDEELDKVTERFNPWGGKHPCDEIWKEASAEIDRRKPKAS